MDNGGSPNGGGEINPGVANNQANPTVNAAQNSPNSQNPADRQPLRYVSPTQPYDNGPTTPPTPSNPPLTQMPVPDLSVVNPRPVSTGRGDIILNPAAEAKKAKNSKHVPIIILMILSALFTVAIIGFIAYRSLSGSPAESSESIANSSTPTTPATGALADFNTYANYIFYGTDSSDYITGEEPSLGQYAYDQYLYNGLDFNTSYFNQAYTKFNNFYNSFKRGYPNITSGDFYNSINDYKQLLEFIRINPSGNDFSHETIEEAYRTEGPESAQARIDRALGRIPQDNTYADQFREYKEAEFDSTLQYMQSLEENGCISEDRTLDEECAFITRISYDNFEDSPIYAIYQNSGKANDLLNDYFEYIGTNCWQIKNAIEENIQ